LSLRYFPGRALGRHKPDFNSFAEGFRNAPQHCGGVTLVVGILEPADCRRRGPNLPGQLPLREPRLCAQVIDRASNIDIRGGLLIFGNALRIFANVTIPKIL